MSNEAVELGLELLRTGQATSVAAAARTAGVPRTTLQTRWADDPAFKSTRPHGLPEEPDAGPGGEIPVFTVDYSSLDSLHLYPLGDLHIGSPNFAEAAFRRWVEYLVATDGVAMLGTGDQLNCALSTSVSDEYGEKLTVKEARQTYVKLVAPVAEAGKLNGLIDGNHEMRVYRATGDSPNSAIADQLDVPYSQAAAVFRYLVGDQSYDVFLRHGGSGGSTYGAAVNRLAKQESIIDADIYISGHTHTQIAFPKNVFVPNEGGGFSRKKRLFVCSGSFLSYEDYAATAGYPPAHIGAPRVFMDGSRRDFHASV